jgi:hypothetical protein
VPGSPHFCLILLFLSYWFILMDKLPVSTSALNLAAMSSDSDEHST